MENLWPGEPTRIPKAPLLMAAFNEPVLPVLQLAMSAAVMTQVTQRLIEFGPSAAEPRGRRS